MNLPFHCNSCESKCTRSHRHKSHEIINVAICHTKGPLAEKHDFFPILFKMFNNCFLNIILLVSHQDEVGKCVEESHQQVCKTYVYQEIVGRVPHTSMACKEYGKKFSYMFIDFRGLRPRV